MDSSWLSVVAACFVLRHVLSLSAGFMNVGAVVNFWRDMAERRSTLARLQTPEAGFCELPDGTWVWRCVQEPLASAVQAPSGSAVVLAGIIGLVRAPYWLSRPACAC